MHGAVPQLQDYLEHSARRLPDKVALVQLEERVTYQQLDRRSNALAQILVERGISRGDRVIIFADNSIGTVIGFWAVLKANAVVSVVSPLTKADKLAYYLTDCRAAALIADAHLKRVWREPAAKSPWLKTTIVAPNDPALNDARDEPPRRQNIDIDLASIIYTSGSTGDPKGVMLTRRNMVTAATSITTYLQNVEDDVILCVLPLAFDYGLYQMIMACRMGARLVIEKARAAHA